MEVLLFVLLIAAIFVGGCLALKIKQMSLELDAERVITSSQQQTIERRDSTIIEYRARIHRLECELGVAKHELDELRDAFQKSISEVQGHLSDAQFLLCSLPRPSTDDEPDIGGEGDE